MSKEHIATFIDQIEQMLTTPASDDGDAKVGLIESFADGVIEITGLSNLKVGEVVKAKALDVHALVLNLEKDRAYAVVIEAGAQLKEGMFVESNGSTLSMPVSDSAIGRVLDSLGNPLDGNGPYETKDRMDHESIAPGVMSREPVSQPMQTGIVGIDALIPIGRGQRELIIGDRQTGKTSVALDTIINQKGQDMICIYVSVAQREGKLRQVYEKLKAAGAMDYTTIVSAPASSSAAMQFLAPYAGSALAEHFLAQGKDVLIIYDDLSKQAVAYREMSLLLRRPPGREAYPGDVFYIHSRLLERAVRLNESHGGGSITALPIIETQAGDVSAYIPTNVISITDGQIFLETDLFNKGIRPAINIGISVSRVGGSAQTKIMKKIAGTAKMDLAQYYELEAFSQFASDLDDATKQKLTRGSRVVESLKQEEGKPYALWQQIIVLHAATKGYLDKYELPEIKERLSYLLNTIADSKKDLVDDIMKEKALTDSIAERLDGYVREILEV